MARLRKLGYALFARAVTPLDMLAGPLGTGRVGILCYHRVVPPPRGPAPTYNVPPDNFRRQLEGLLRLGFEPWSLRQVLDHVRSRLEVPRRAFVVTFDDGYASNYHFAWPILKELRIPATIFLATAYLDAQSAFPFDDWRCAGAKHVDPIGWKPLTTAQCQEMAADGLVELGAHTHTHRDFSGRPLDFQDDLSACVNLLRDRFGVTAPAFAFPFGKTRLGFPAGTFEEIARELGLSCALKVENDLAVLERCPLDWPRFHADGSDTARTLSAKLDGWYSVARDSLCGASRAECRRFCTDPAA